jgi:hypothetical protein
MPGRLRTLSVALVACGTCALLDAGPALAADEPIVGRWQQIGGIVEYYATGPNKFESRVIKKGTGSCSDKPADIKLTGSGLRYTGTVRYYRTSDCEFVGNGTLEITLESDGDTGQFVARGPDGGSPFQATIKRDPGPLSGTGSLLPGTAYGALLNLQVRYKQATRKKKLHKKVRDAARTYRRAVQRFHPSDRGDRDLRNCASLALATVINGAKLERSGRGLRQLLRCLQPYRDANIVPKQDPGGHHYVGSSPQIPRFEFDVVDGKATAIAITWATKCGGKGYASTFDPNFSVPLDDKLHFEYSAPLFSAATGEQTGAVDHTLGTVGRASAGGKTEWSFDDPSDSPDAGVTCTTGSLKWSARL